MRIRFWTLMVLVWTLSSCTTAPKQTETDFHAARRIVENYMKIQSATDARDPASSMAQNHYALLSSDEQFNKLLDAQAAQHFQPILFAQNSELKKDCNCWQYALFFRNDDNHQVRLSMVVLEKFDDMTKVKSLGKVTAIPDDEIGIQTKNFLTSMGEFSTSD